MFIMKTADLEISWDEDINRSKPCLCPPVPKPAHKEPWDCKGIQEGGCHLDSNSQVDLVRGLISYICLHVAWQSPVHALLADGEDLCCSTFHPHVIFWLVRSLSTNWFLFDSVLYFLMVWAYMAVVILPCCKGISCSFIRDNYYEVTYSVLH